MKATLHKLPEGFVLTSDEEIKSGSVYYDFDLKTIIQWKGMYAPATFHPNKCKQVVAHPHQIDLSGLKPEEQSKIGWWDVEKLAEELYPNSNKLAPHIHITPKIKKQSRHKQHFIKGFQAVLDLVSDGKFTVEDVKSFATHFHSRRLQHIEETIDSSFKAWQSLYPPNQWQVEYEEVDGKFKILALI